MEAEAGKRHSEVRADPLDLSTSVPVTVPPWKTKGCVYTDLYTERISWHKGVRVIEARNSTFLVVVPS